MKDKEKNLIFVNNLLKYWRFNLMKKLIVSLMCVFVMTLLVTSCYTHTYSVGKGAQTGIEVTEKNHYLILGLVPLSTSNPSEMAGGAQNYTVTHEHTFVDGLINAITGGIYTPTTTTVRK